MGSLQNLLPCSRMKTEMFVLQLSKQYQICAHKVGPFGYATSFQLMPISDYFKEAMNIENCVSRLSEKLSDDNSSVRSAAFQAMSMLSSHG
jgi:hypothetical protein